MQAATLELRLSGLRCANCADKIQSETGKLKGVSEVNLNFTSQKLRVSLAPDVDRERISEDISQIVSRIEPDVVVEPFRQENDHAHDRGHDHEGMPRSRLVMLGLSAVLFGVGFALEGPAKAAVYVVSYLLAGYDILWRAIRNIGTGSFFDENLLMSVASVSAVLLGEYAEGVAVMLLYQVGEFFQARAVGKSRNSIKALLDIRPQNAWLVEDGQSKQVLAADVQVGQIIQVRPGERIPLDGVVRSGSAAVDASALTGESLPREVNEGDEAMSGCVALDGMLELEVTRAYADTTVARILHMVEEASEKKAPTEQFISRFSRYYTPAVVAAAALLAILPPLLVPGAQWHDWIYRAMTFLVVSCPCALVISVPLSYVAGIGAASRTGVLVKGAGALDAMCEMDTLAMDKTGTLTTGRFHVAEIVPADGITPEALRFAAATAERHSNHPIARAVTASAEGEPLPALDTVNELSGKGVAAEANGMQYLAGNAALLDMHGITAQQPERAAGSVVHIAEGGRYLGYLLVSDRLKDGVPESIQSLKDAGMRHIVLLTGDSRVVAEDVARQVGIEEVHAELLPAQKLELLEQLQQRTTKKVGFVGDGINDAPVLAQADVGMAMGGLGADAAIEAADVVLMTDEPRTIVSALRVARRTRSIVLQNILFALAVKAVVLVLSAFGIANMWTAVFADVGVSLLAVLNAMRALQLPEAKR